MTWRLVLPWCPWLVAEAALGYVEAQFWPDGGLWLLVMWTVVLVLYRTAIAATEQRLVRLAGDAFFAGICVLAVFEGGWYVLPAVVAFAACDAVGLRMHLSSLADSRDGHELGGALAATVVGWLGLAIAVSGPSCTTVTSIVQASGQVVDITSQVGLLQRGCVVTTVRCRRAPQRAPRDASTESTARTHGRESRSWRDSPRARIACLPSLPPAGNPSAGHRGNRNVG